MSCNHTEKYSSAALSLLKANLGYFDSEIPLPLERHLKFLLCYAYDDFSEMNIRLTPGVMKDDLDQMVHAAWMYRNGTSGKGKHEMLRTIIRNRQVSQALGSDSKGAST